MANRKHQTVLSGGRDLTGEVAAWPEVCGEHQSARTLWCVTCEAAVCTGCLVWQRCGAHTVSDPGDRGGLATRMVLPNKMADYWSPRAAWLSEIVGTFTGVKPRVSWDTARENAWVDGPHRTVKLLLTVLGEQQEFQQKKRSLGEAQQRREEDLMNVRAANRWKGYLGHLRSAGLLPPPLHARARSGSRGRGRGNKAARAYSAGSTAPEPGA